MDPNGRLCPMSTEIDVDLLVEIVRILQYFSDNVGY